MQHRAPIIITPEEEQEILQKIDELDNLLPDGMVTLTEEQRKVMPMMGDKTMPFVEKSIEIAMQNPLLKPAYINIDDALTNFDACRTLGRISRALAPIVGRLKDTAQISGSEAFTASLSIYNAARDGERHGVPGSREAVQELSPRFPGRSPAKPKEDKGETIVEI